MQDPEVALDPSAATGLWSALERLSQLAIKPGTRFQKVERRVLDDLLAAAAHAEQQMIAHQLRIRYLESLSITDELTGLLNRRGFRQGLDRALARAQRRGEGGLLALLDLDRFKAVNDSFGHPAGDTVLRALADLLRRHTRCNDEVARLGGDEFAVLMTDSSADQAEGLSGKLRHVIGATRVTHEGHEIPLSASVGVEPYGVGSSAEGLLFVADRALYKNKRPRLLDLG